MIAGQALVATCLINISLNLIPSYLSILLLCAQSTLIQQASFLMPLALQAFGERALHQIFIDNRLVQIAKVFGHFYLSLAAVSLMSCQVLAAIPIGNVLIIELLLE